MSSKCNICKKEMNTGTVDSVDCGGDCLQCMADAGDTDCAGHIAWVNGFNAACELLISDMTKDVYGIGSMCSQWTAEEVGEDMKQRAMEVWNARKSD